MEIGTRLGPYEILAPIGAGGMGEVYRARDTRLDREVAIKILPDTFAADRDRLARFEREAKLLASLNHPGIASIYGVEHHALVMEMVEGATLEDRINQGSVPTAEALEILMQIAGALEYAHEHGIIHRDLKPANIKINSEDKVKILDFGLAKAFTDPANTASSDPAASPTITIGATTAGTILGTAAYMAPEQARGKKVDKRADIWAFGVIAYEILSGKRLFKGDDSMQVLGRVMEQKIDFEPVPARFRALVTRCLERNPKDRLRDIGDARYLLDPPAEQSKRRRAILPWAIAAVLLLGLGTLSAIHFREQPAQAPRPVRLQFIPDNLNPMAEKTFALSPDGTKLAFLATDQKGVWRMGIRAMDTLESHVIASDFFSGLTPPFWSPDSRYLFFSTQTALRKIDISAGAEQTVCQVPGQMQGGSSNADGTIIFGTLEGPIWRVQQQGGIAEPVTVLDPARGERRHIAPVFLPDGRHFLYLSEGRPESSGIYVGSLEGKKENAKLVMPIHSSVEFAPSRDGESGAILFLREGTLFAQQFDLRRLELTGQPVPIADNVGHDVELLTQASVSANGTLVIRSGTTTHFALTWFDRRGNVIGKLGEPDYHSFGAAISPDGSRVAASRFASDQFTTNIWLIDSRGRQTRLSSGQGVQDFYPAWSPDGSRVVFTSTRDGHDDLYVHSLRGESDELLLRSDHDKSMSHWSPDGRFLVYTDIDPKSHFDLWILPMDGSGKPFPFLKSEFNELGGRFSPDGRWIAYASDETGTYEVYVRAFPDRTGMKWVISQSGAGLPRWRGDGRELFFVSGGQIMASEISVKGTDFQAGPPKVLFKTKLPWATDLDVSRDGNRFLIPLRVDESTQSPFIVILNWTSLLKK